MPERRRKNRQEKYEVIEPGTASGITR